MDDFAVTSKHDDIDPASLKEWRRSRSGAWAARGFDFQHAVSTLMLVRQWAGVTPPGQMVPEGFDDCVIEFADTATWIQAKSRHTGMFRKTEVEGFLDVARARAARLPAAQGTRTVVVLERPIDGIRSTPIDRLFDDGSGDVFVCASPSNEIITLLDRQLDTAQVTIEGIANDLQRLVEETSAENASKPFDQRHRLSAAEAERRILDRLNAEDPSSNHEALATGVLAPVELATPVQERAFYQGVKVRPGHVAAGLVLERHTDTTKVVNALENRKHVLLTGPSGAGKSALVWLTASTLQVGMRWFEITSIATAAHAESIVRFIRSRRPTTKSPIALAFDDIGPIGSDLWNVLVRELRGLSAVYLLGSVRQEDLTLISNQSDTDTIPVQLGHALAEDIWRKLSATDETTWTHWREPFEQSEGLLLEYVHLLTRGQRLAAVIGDQVRQRQTDGRYDELAIIRSTAVVCVHGGEIDATRLLKLLGLGRDTAAQALRRLLDEHIVLEMRPGVLGGLHLLRSRALADASHDELTSVRTETLWQSFPSTTHDSLPMVVQSVLSASSGLEQLDILNRLAITLRRSHDIDVWVAILTGLGLATVERYVSSFTAILEAHEVPRTHWSLATGFASTDIDMPDLAQSDDWHRLREAVWTFRASKKFDLRSACLDRIPDGQRPTVRAAVDEASRLLSCLVPICATQPASIPLELSISDISEADVYQIAKLLSTAYLVSPNRAKAIVTQAGGQQALLDLFHSQIPWTTPPSFETDGEHGNTIRSDWFHVAEGHQPDPHEVVCRICETLIALAPDADAAASDALDPAGKVVAVGNFRPWSKNIPRANLPAKSLVAWNVAFGQVLQARVAQDTLTDYARNMTALVQSTERLFRTFTEKWVQGRRLPNVDAFAAQTNEVIETAKGLAYSFPDRPSATMTEPAKRGDDDSLGTLIAGVLGNLLVRLGDIRKGKATATFAGNLAVQAREQLRSDLWRVSPNPPLKELSALADRLRHVSRILHELSGDPNYAPNIARTVRRTRLDDRTAAASRHSLARAKHRLAGKLQRLTATLRRSGHSIRCCQRPVRDAATPFWPPREIAVLVELPDIELESLAALDDALTIAEEHLGNDWPFRVAPVVQGKVIADLAFSPSSQMALPDQDFVANWSAFLEQPIRTIADSAGPFDNGIAACHQVSAILACRGCKDLHPEEEHALSQAIESVERAQEAITETAERTGMGCWLLARAYLDVTWRRVTEEYEAMRAGETVADPLCMAPLESLSGSTHDHTSELAVIRLELVRSDASNTQSDLAGFSRASED